MDCIGRSNEVIFICYTFIKAYVLHCYENKTPIPNLDSDFIRMCFKAISKKSAGPKPKGTQLENYNKLCAFFDNVFVDVLRQNKDAEKSPKENIEDYKFDRTNLPYILNYAAVEMQTIYQNNITINFFKYVHQYVNENFIKRTVKKLSREEYRELIPSEKLKYTQERREEDKKIKILRSELMKIKNDLCDNKGLTSDEKYHEWIDKNRKIIFPELEEGIFTYKDDIKFDHFKYFKHMLQMNDFLEKNGSKLFSAIPLRTQLYDKYVDIDSNFLKDLYKEIGSKSSKQQKKTNDDIWNKYFNVSKTKFKIKGYSFNHMISTDGTTVSLSFIKNDQIEKENKKKTNKASASKRTKGVQKTMTISEIQESKTAKGNVKLQKKKEDVVNNAKFIEASKEKYKKMSVEEKKKVKVEIRKKENKYEKIEDAVKDLVIRKELSELLEDGKIVVADPGVRAPGTFLGKRTKHRLKKSTKNRWRNNKRKKKVKVGKQRGDDILFSYSAGRRINELERLRNLNRLETKKTLTNIDGISLKEQETELSKYSTKTVNLAKFLEVSKIKIALRKEIMLEKTYNEYVKKLKWYGYINKRRHEANLLNELEEIYGKGEEGTTIIIGDWSAGSCIKRISMPNAGLKKLLEQRFRVYLIDEFNTSKLNWISEKEGEHVTVEEKHMEGGKEIVIKKQLHSVLRFKIGKKDEGCINRDYNATRNMLKIVRHLVKHGVKPTAYSRYTTEIATEDVLQRGKAIKTAYREVKEAKTKIIDSDSDSEQEIVAKRPSKKNSRRKPSYSDSDSE